MSYTQTYYVLTLATSPPGSPALLDAHFVNGVGTGAWTGHDHEMAVDAGGVWLFRAPKLGDLFFNADDDTIYSWNGSALVASGGGGGGSGDVVGPASSADRNITIFDGATGKLVKDSGVAMDDVFTAVGQAAQATADINAGTGASVLAPAQITANQNDYAPTGYATAAQFQIGRAHV